jgi:hypothetical protein
MRRRAPAAVLGLAAALLLPLAGRDRVTRGDEGPRHRRDAPADRGGPKVTVVALAPAFASVIVRRGRISRLEWAVLGGSTVAVAALLAYAASVEGLPRPW